MALPQNRPISQASADLGLGGMLSDQVKGETEEERKKRMLAVQQQSLGLPAMSAVSSLFGAGGRGGY
jgi:hypothetical protein